MREAARRQILLDMGIVTWRLRAQDPSDSPDAAAAPAPMPEERPERRPETPAAPVRDLPPATGRASAETLEVIPRREAAAVHVPPWAALSLATPGVLLLVEGDSSRRDLRLAADLLAAVSGNWRARPLERRFEWPPALLGGVAADDGRKAFQAFVDKDVTDHGVSRLLCVEPLAWALPEEGSGCRQQVIPPLTALGGDAEAKRALWRSLGDERR